MSLTLLNAVSLLQIDWRGLLLGEDKWTFLIEVALRSVVMFIIILVALRLLGKRSITQLSVFELGVIIGLGSAAGDPMFYKDVGLLPGLAVFITIVSLYRLMTFLINRSEKAEQVLEGKPVYVIEEGKMLAANFKKESIAHDEFFSLLRQHHVTHLGQVERALIETNGAVSLYFYPDEAVRWGLPILPHLCEKATKQLTRAGHYACFHCGQVADVDAAKPTHTCTDCGKDRWVEAIKTVRIS